MHINWNYSTENWEGEHHEYEKFVVYVNGENVLVLDQARNKSWFQGETAQSPVNGKHSI